METNKELMRAEFEAAYGPKEGFAWLNPDNTYKSQAIQDGWEIWQKAWQARAALSQRSEAPQHIQCDDACRYHCTENGRIDPPKCVSHAPSAAAGDQVQDHVLREVVNDLRDTAIKFHDTQQLRERLRRCLDPLLAAQEPTVWDADATARLRSIVDLLGLQSSVPEGDLTGYEFAVLGFVRREIEQLKAAAQPTPAQGDAVPVESNSNGLEREAAELARADQSPVKITDDELAAFHRFCDCCEDFDAGGHDVPKDMMRQLTLIGLVRAAGPNRHETTNFGDWIRDASNTGTPPANATRQSSADAVDAARYRELRKDSQMYYVAYRNEDMGWAFSQINMDKLDKYIDAAIAAQGGKGGA